MAGQRSLDKNAMDSGVSIETVDFGDKFVLGDAFRVDMELAFDAKASGDLLLFGHVRDRGRILPYPDKGGAGLGEAVAFQFFPEAGEDFFGDGFAVYDIHG
jgi:hypothetical protein